MFIAYSPVNKEKQQILGNCNNIHPLHPLHPSPRRWNFELPTGERYFIHCKPICVSFLSAIKGCIVPQLCGWWVPLSAHLCGVKCVTNHAYTDIQLPQPLVGCLSAPLDHNSTRTESETPNLCITDAYYSQPILPPLPHLHGLIASGLLVAQFCSDSYYHLLLQRNSFGYISPHNTSSPVITITFSTTHLSISLSPYLCLHINCRSTSPWLSPRTLWTRRPDWWNYFCC